MKSAAAIVFACGLAALAACDEGDPPRRPTELPPVTSPGPTGLDLDAALAAAASAAATPSASASAGVAGANATTLTGSWEGKFEAKKATLSLPTKIKDKERTAYGGKVAVGAGTISLTVAPTGEARGRCKGALGDGALVGKVDGAWVRVTLMPDDPSAASAMTGVVVARIVEGKLEGELRAAGPDALLVREAAISLAKK